MTGEEMKTYLRQRGLSLASVAEELGTSPQNLNGKLKAKSLKSDFISAIKAIIDKCAPPCRDGSGCYRVERQWF